MKHTLPEKSTTKLPKRYWFILIFMCFIAILQLLHLSAYVYIKVNDFDKRDVVTLLLSIILFAAFVFLYALLIRSFNNYRQKLNIIKIHIITFYMILVSLLIYVYKQFELAPDLFPLAISAKYREAFLMAGDTGMNYFILISIFIIFSTFYLIFGKKTKNIQISMPPLTQFIIYWGIAFIINFPPLVAYLVVISSVAS